MPFKRAVDQRGETELRLEVVRAAGGLPHVRGAGVPLVPHLPEERRERDLGVRVVELPAPQLASLVECHETVGLGSEGDGPERIAAGRLQGQQGLAGRAEGDVETSPRVAGDESLVTPRRREAEHRCAVRREPVDASQTTPTRRILHHLPARHTPGLVTRHERAIADEEPQHPDGGAIGRRVDRLGEHRAGRSPEVVPEELAARGPEEEVLAAPVQPERRDLALDRGHQRLTRLLPATGADESLALLHALQHQLRRADLRNGQRTGVGRHDRHAKDRAPLIGIDGHGIAECHLRGDVRMPSANATSNPTSTGSTRPSDVPTT